MVEYAISVLFVKSVLIIFSFKRCVKRIAANNDDDNNNNNNSSC